MPLSKTWNNTSYSIPQAGEINWAALTTFLSDLADNAQTSIFQKFAVRVATTTPVTVNAATDCVVISNLGVAGAVAVNLPAGATKQIFMIVDGKGDAATNNITITPAAGNINGAATYVMNVNNAGVALVYDGTQWTIFAEFTRFSSGTGIIPRNKIAAGTADHVVINDGSGNLSSEAQLVSTRGGTGVSNAGTLTYGANNITITTSGVTSLTVPTSGTVATLAGSEILSNKTLASPLVSGGSIDVTAAGALAIGASVGANNITLGGATSTVIVSGDFTVNGTTTTINTSVLDVEDANISVNVGGNDASSEGAGLRVARTGTAGSLIYAAAATSKWKVGALGSEVEVADISSAQALTNKTIDSDSNTITNIVDGDIKSTAAIDRTKLASGTADHVVINNGSGVMSSEAQLASTRGGTGVNNAGTLTYGANNIAITTSGATAITLPTSGTVATLAGTESLSSKTLTAAKAGDYFDFTEVAAPSTPGSGFVRVYAKSDNKVYQKDDAGVESLLGGGSGSGSGEVNAVLNPSASTDTTGWSDDATHTNTRDTSNSPLAPITSSCFAMAASATTPEGSNSGVYYTITTQPTGLRNKKLKVEFYMTTPASADGIWALSVRAGGTTRMSLSTDSSSITTLPSGVTGKFTAYFDADASTSYTVNFTNTTLTNANTLYVTGLIVGPDKSQGGAVVEQWKTYTPSWESTGTAPAVGNGTIYGVYRRVGDSAEVEILLRSGTTTTYGTGNYRWTIPSGLTIDTTRIPANYNDSGGSAVFGTALAGFSSYTVSAVSYNTTTSVTGSVNTSTWTQTHPFTPSGSTAGNIWSLKFTVPISEWAGSGTVNLAQNDPIFASTSGSWNADDSTTQYGPSGASITGNNSAARIKTITWPTPSAMDTAPTVQISQDSGVTWTNAIGTQVQSTNTSIGPLHRISSAGLVHGVSVRHTSATTTVVTFGEYSGSYEDGTVTDNDWADFNTSTTKWRVMRATAGQAVGFGIVDPGVSSGLVSASGLPGNDTGNSIATGYVGEVLDATGTFTGTPSNTALVTVTLTTGVWLINANAYTDDGNADVSWQWVIKGTAGSTDAKDRGYSGGAPTRRYCWDWSTRVVVVASGDATKTVIARVVGGANTSYYGYSIAVRIA